MDPNKSVYGSAAMSVLSNVKVNVTTATPEARAKRA